MKHSLTSGNDFFKNDDYINAIKEYEKALSETPYLKEEINFNLKLCHLKLNSGTQTIKKFKHKNSNYEGNFESIKNLNIKGWSVNKKKPSEIFELTIKINGVTFCRLKNNQRRGDLQRLGKSNGLGGFSIQLPVEAFNLPMQKLEVLLPDGNIIGEVQVTQKKPTSLLPVKSQFDITPVSIIVPIYNAPDDLEVCIDRLIKYTSPKVDIILINDASPDRRINEILKEAKIHKNIRIFHNKENLGFTKTVNRGIDLAGSNDVVFLNSDARVTPRWLEGLKVALSTDPTIATVTPMSDRAGAFSAPNMGNDNELPNGVKEEDYAVAFRRRSIGLYPTVPTGNGFCLYVRRQCINEIGPLDQDAFPRGYGEENDFCMRARSHGWRNIIDDRTYVFHDRNKSFGGSKTELIKAGRKVVDERYPDYKKAISVFSESPLISLARYRSRIALQDVESSILPRGLFVISTLTGGTPQTNRDLMLSVNDKIEPWLLHCDSNVISLYKVSQMSEDELIKRYTLKEPINSLTHTSSEYDQVISNWLAEFDFELVHIRHLAWHSLNLPKVAKQSGARVIKSFHDYYAICPTVKLLDNNRKFCSGICSKSKGDCTPELWDKDSFPHLKNKWVYTWREKFKEAVKDCDSYITTHDSAKELLINNLELDEKKFTVIPHGRDFEDFHQLAEPYQEGDVLKILVPGNINDAKGSKIIENILELDSDGKIEFHILGRCSGELSQLKHPRLISHGEYKRDEFAKHVKKIRPHIGAVLSIWNETWCHTLTELWSVGLPVIVTNYATVAQRVLDSNTGWVVDSENPEHILEILNSSEKKYHLDEFKKNTINLQKNTLPKQNNKDMAIKYLSCYK